MTFRFEHHKKILTVLECLDSDILDKPEKSYQVIRPLKRAIARFQERPDYREKCFLSLQVDQAQIPKIIDGK